MKENKQKILVIVGPTASGKTSLGVQLAKKFNGEIISADSRQVYRGLNIGTGKVTQEETDGVPHHLFDIADPSATYTVARFVRDGERAITEIISRQKLPIIVGGTFLYIDALLGKISTPEVPPNETLRNELETCSIEVLVERLKRLDSVRLATVDTHNRRRLIRAIEIATAIGSVPKTITEKKYDVCMLGIDISQEELRANIHVRLIERIDAGMIDEVKALHSNGLSYERMEDLGLEYRYIARHLKGTLSYEALLIELETKIRQYSKRQMTWLKRDASIVWVNPKDIHKIIKIIKNFLQ